MRVLDGRTILGAEDFLIDSTDLCMKLLARNMEKPVTDIIQAMPAIFAQVMAHLLNTPEVFDNKARQTAGDILIDVFRQNLQMTLNVDTERKN